MIKNIENVKQIICNELKNFTDIAVIGLSGGADSTLVACLCTEALGAENVYGISMPYGDTDITTFNARSVKLATILGINQSVILIKDIAVQINIAISRIKEYGRSLDYVNEGNARSRARMCVLYGITHSLGSSLGKRVRVLGTGNLSEDYIGYDTKGGDALADIFPIGNLFKSEVYQFLDYYKERGVLTEDLIDRVPSAGLWEGQTDADEIGYTYDEMESAIRFLKFGTLFNPCNYKEDDKIVQFVRNRHHTNKHKHEVSPVISLERGKDLI